MTVAQTNHDDEARADLARGVESAFAALYDRHGARMLRVAWALLGDPAEAEDAVQDAFVSLVRSRDALSRARSIEAYLIGAVRNAALRRRDARPRREIPLDALDEPAATDWSGVRDEGLERALESLPADQRDVVVLRHDAALPFVDIAGLLGIGINTVTSRYRYAIDKLRRALEGDR